MQRKTLLLVTKLIAEMEWLAEEYEMINVNHVHSAHSRYLVNMAKYFLDTNLLISMLMNKGRILKQVLLEY